MEIEIFNDQTKKFCQIIEVRANTKKILIIIKDNKTEEELFQEQGMLV